MVDFALSEVQLELQRQAREIADRELRPHAARWDREESFPDRSYKVLCESGLLDVTLPVEYGGRGLGVLEACIVIEELARGCMASAMIAQMFLNGPSQVLVRHGNDAQRARWLSPATRRPRYWAVAMTEPAAGSAATELVTELSDLGGEYRLNGEKCYITGGNVADSFLVFCRAAGSAGPRGIGAVVVDRGANGFAEPESEGKMGSAESPRPRCGSPTSPSPRTRLSCGRIPPRRPARQSSPSSSTPNASEMRACAWASRNPR